MVVSSLEGLSDAQKQELIASLSSIVVGSAGGEVSAESLSAVATASGNSLSGAWASVFATAVDKVRKICVWSVIMIWKGVILYFANTKMQLSFLSFLLFERLDQLTSSVWHQVVVEAEVVVEEVVAVEMLLKK